MRFEDQKSLMQELFLRDILQEFWTFGVPGLIIHDNNGNEDKILINSYL